MTSVRKAKIGDCYVHINVFPPQAGWRDYPRELDYFKKLGHMGRELDPNFSKLSNCLG